MCVVFVDIYYRYEETIGLYGTYEGPKTKSDGKRRCEDFRTFATELGRK